MELRPLVLALLETGAYYGYEIVRHAKRRADVDWEEGTIYPLLHKMEKEGLLSSEWRKAPTGKDRKYYALTRKGKTALAKARTEWKDQVRVISGILLEVPMDARREILRRILSATGAAGRLTDEQREEILGHLEDSVDDKVRAGANEMEASAQAFEELGDVRKIAGQFPAGPAVAATAEGPWVRWGTYGVILEGHALLLVFCLFQVLILPKLVDVFSQVNVPLPAMTTFFIDLSQGMSRYSLVLWTGIVAVVIAQFMLSRRRFVRPTAFLMGLASIVLVIGAVISSFLPFVGIMRGMGAPH